MAKYKKVASVYQKQRDDSWIVWVLGGFVLIAVLASAG